MDRKKWLVGGVVLLVATAAGLGFWWPFRSDHEIMRLTGVVEIREVHLGSRVGGRIEGLFVEEGDHIKGGQLLVKLAEPELEAQREQWEAKLREAQAQLKKAEVGPRKEEKDAAWAARNAALAKWNRYKVGYRQEEKASARANLESALADLKQMQEEFARVTRLFARGAATQAEVDVARGNLDRSRGREQAARAQWEQMERGYREEEIAEAEGEFRRLDAEYELLRAGTRSEDVQAAMAHVEDVQGKLMEIRAQLAEGEVRAPANVPGKPEWEGVVEVVSIRRGDLVAANQAMIRVLQANDLWVKVYVPETDLGKISLNQQVEVKCDTYPDKRFQGTIIQIASISEFTPRNVQSIDERKHQMFGVKVHISDPQGVFKAGMAAEVFIPVNRR